MIEGHPVILIKPMTYMNRSGIAIRRFLDFFSVSNRGILIIHDDIDIEFGRIKIKEKGGDGGHKGVRSVIEVLGKGDFARLRIGIGRSEFQRDVSDFVLSEFSRQDQLPLKKLLEKAQDAVVTILCKGTKEGMNRFNNKKP